jgi:hypothetical protein
MRVTFTRLPDHEWGSVLIERDDGVIYRMGAGPITAAIPHDLVHFTVEDALGLADGIWGAIAGGVVFRSMKHVSGRRPPHAAERSAALIAAYRGRLQRAELIGGFVEAAAHRSGAAPAEHRPGARLVELAGQAFVTLPPADQPELGAIAGAVAALHGAERRWQEVPIGGALVFDWPARRRLAPVARRSGRSGVGVARRPGRAR